MGGSVLFVDDEPNIREAVDLVLGDSFDLRLAASAEEALAMPGAESVRVIFLDGLMGPGMTGDHALPCFKRKFPGACIVYIGASGSIKVPALKAAGVSIVLPKPWKVEELQATAREGMHLAGAMA